MNSHMVAHKESPLHNLRAVQQNLWGLKNNLEELKHSLPHKHGCNGVLSDCNDFYAVTVDFMDQIPALIEQAKKELNGGKHD